MVILKIFAFAILMVLSVYLIADAVCIAIAMRKAIKDKERYEKNLSLEFVCLFFWGVCLGVLIYY